MAAKSFKLMADAAMHDRTGLPHQPIVKMCVRCHTIRTDLLETYEACHSVLCPPCYLIPDCPENHDQSPYHVGVTD